MTNRERILAAVNHQPVDRIPTDMWATPEVQEILYDHFQINAGKETQTDTIGLLGGYLSGGVEALLILWDRLGVDGIIDVCFTTMTAIAGSCYQSWLRWE